MRLDKCNDSVIASKLVVDVRVDFFNAEGAECAEKRELKEITDYSITIGINLDYTTGYTLYTYPGVLLKVFFVQGISLLFFLPGNLRK